MIRMSNQKNSEISPLHLQLLHETKEEILKQERNMQILIQEMSG